MNDDITAFLPADTDTRRGLTVMEEEFVTYADAKVMLANTTYERAEAAMNDMLGGIGAGLADARYLMQEAIFVAGDTRDIINSLFVMPIDTPADGLLPTETTPSEWLERNSAAADTVLAAYTVKAPGYTGEGIGGIARRRAGGFTCCRTERQSRTASRATGAISCLLWKTAAR